MLTGGLLHCDAIGELSSVAVDFLTVTVGAPDVFPDGAGAYLLGHTKLDEPGFARPGFAASEKRTCLGGYAWRRMEPRQPSHDFGLDYESWECEGGAAQGLSRDLRGVGPVRPSRVDVAFDLAVSAAMTSDELVKRLQQASGEVGGHHLRGRSLGISGQGGVNTCYVGSSRSEKRVRIYRKDLQSEAFAEFFGPTLRVELVLRGDESRRWWAVWQDEEDRGKRAAATVLRSMTGLHVLEGVEDLPEVERPEAASEGENLFQFVKQNGAKLEAWRQSGIDVMALVAESHGVPGNRMAASRQRRRLRALAEAGPGAVVSIARALLGLH